MEIVFLPTLLGTALIAMYFRNKALKMERHLGYERRHRKDMRFRLDTLVDEVWDTKQEINLFHFLEERIQKCDRHLDDEESWKRMFNKTLEEASVYSAMSEEEKEYRAMQASIEKAHDEAQSEGFKAFLMSESGQQ